jgi:hypothetical protein
MMTGEIWTLYKSVIIDLKIEDIIWERGSYTGKIRNIL